MHVGVHYLAQVKQAAGRASERVPLEAPCPAREFVRRLAEGRGGALRDLLLDAGGELRPTILLFVGETQVGPGERVELKDGDEVTVLAPMAGG